MAAETSFHSTWDYCDDQTQINKVKIKEDAVQTAQHHAAEMKLKLELAIDRAKGNNVEVSDHFKELQEILDREDAIRQQHCQHQILAGVAGASGAGKTSAINSWLGIRDLLPTSCEQAATAVVCLVSWNFDERPGYEFRAEIDFHSPDVIWHEVKEYFATLKKRDEIQDQREDNDPLAAENKREVEACLKSMFLKIKAVWRCSQENLENMTAESLWRSRPEVIRLLSGTRSFQSSEALQLSEAVGPYLGSTERTHEDGQKSSAWPFVKCVRIFLRADVLKHGLTLVDLPGLGDANSARAQVARDYFPKLTVTVIVSPIERAADEKTANDLLDEHHETRLQLDGKYDAQGFGFVLSKIDHMDPKSFLRHATDRPSLRIAKQKQAAMQNTNKELSDISKDLKGIGKSLRSLHSLHKKRKIEFENARARRQMAKSMTGERNSLDKEIRHLEERLKSSLQQRQAQKKLRQRVETSRRKKRRACKMDSSQLKSICIQARNDFVVDRIRDDISQRMSRSGPQGISYGSAAQVQIIPISSEAFFELAEDPRSAPGFLDMEATGIPQVKQWLRSTALTQREEHLDMVLNQYSCLLRRLHECSADPYDDEHQNIFTKEDVEEVLVIVHRRFKQSLNIELAELEVEIQAINPLRGRAGIIRKCLENLPQIISDWSLRTPDAVTSSDRMAWRTYQAILSRDGEDFRSINGTIYRWLDKLATPVLQHLVQDWTIDIHKKVPDLLRRHLEWFATCWTSYMESIKFHLETLSPALATQFMHRENGLVAIRNTIRDHITQALSNIKADAAMAHPNLRRSLQSSLVPIFAEALGITGSDHYRKRRELIFQKGVVEGNDMFESAFKEVEEALESSKHNARMQLNSTATLAIDKVSESLSRMTQNSHDRGPAEAAMRRFTSPCLGDIRHLSTQWQMGWSKPWAGPAHGADDLSTTDMDNDTEMKLEDSESESDSDSDTDSESATGEMLEEFKLERRSEAPVKAEENTQ